MTPDLSFFSLRTSFILANSAARDAAAGLQFGTTDRDLCSSIATIAPVCPLSGGETHPNLGPSRESVGTAGVIRQAENGLLVGATCACHRL